MNKENIKPIFIVGGFILSLLTALALGDSLINYNWSSLDILRFISENLIALILLAAGIFAVIIGLNMDGKD